LSLSLKNITTNTGSGFLRWSIARQKDRRSQFSRQRLSADGRYYGPGLKESLERTGTSQRNEQQKE